MNFVLILETLVNLDDVIAVWKDTSPGTGKPALAVKFRSQDFIFLDACSEQARDEAMDRLVRRLT